MSARDASSVNPAVVDYIGAGVLHPTDTKRDAGSAITLEEIDALAKVSPVPVVVGGGVKLKDIPALAATGVQGFFVVSAVAGAANPQLAARELVTAWKKFS